uniref:carbamoyl-phosphate synthase arginine-specific small subunit n=1 Tax=Goniotrichopsis reniformis TaxID=468933 RepID=UPI001FCE278C|nr:carbamoyl-phosphate synthase arginine-specific small subunit [Goniotrichopsis reniformis]UNJ14743.1 carbamoyl-phosphate synthase arginine-specific small subunit [Goniotrichopsis reniformis]
MKNKSAILVLEDGTCFKGWSLSHSYTVMGEVVFTTGITGYQEIITDPSYSGQIVIFTAPEIGNTGINNEDNESSQISCEGVITRNLCISPSSWRMTNSLADSLNSQQVPILYGIDTRKLTQHLRSVGAINGCLSNEILDPKILIKKLKVAPSMEGLDLVKIVTSKYPYKWHKPILSEWQFNTLQEKHKEHKNLNNLILVLDCGVKYNILRYLFTLGYKVIVLPATTSIDEILSYKPLGVMLSNGPGDPSAVEYLIKTLKILFTKNIPIFGICMGHQIISLALGAETFKLKFGHRGINHPTGIFQKVEITSQNHGFAVSATSTFSDQVLITHYNLNDYTIAGIVHKTLPIFSVQYHPEASPGPHDADFFFNVFDQMVQKNLNKMQASFI